jgi:hypothetical protein
MKIDWVYFLILVPVVVFTYKFAEFILLHVDRTGQIIILLELMFFLGVIGFVSRNLP